MIWERGIGVRLELIWQAVVLCVVRMLLYEGGRFAELIWDERQIAWATEKTKAGWRKIARCLQSNDANLNAAQPMT